MLARARCVWSKCDLARQTCPERLDRGGIVTFGEPKTTQNHTVPKKDYTTVVTIMGGRQQLGPDRNC